MKANAYQAAPLAITLVWHEYRIDPTMMRRRSVNEWRPAVVHRLGRHAIATSAWDTGKSRPAGGFFG
jgi:hypothetical protein